MKVVKASKLPLEPASHENPRNPGVWKRVLARRADLHPGKVQMINWAVLPPGSSFALHYHEDMQEIFVIVRGHVEIQCDGIKAKLEEGDAVIVSPTEHHLMRNLSTTEEMLYVVVGITGEKNGKTVVL